MDRTFGLVTAGASRAAIRTLGRRGLGRLVVEDAMSSTTVREQAGTDATTNLADLVPTVRDVFHPVVQAQTAVVLAQLRRALRGDEWRFAGVSLWEAVEPGFHWSHLDSLFQATDAANQLFDRLSPARVVVTGLDSYLARAVVAAGRARGIAVDVVERRRELGASHWIGMRPYLAHLRDCVRGARTNLAVMPIGAAPIVCVNHALRNFLVIDPALRELSRRISADRVLVVQTGPGGAQEARDAGFACKSFEAYTSLGEGLGALRSVAPIVRFLRSGRWKAGVSAAGINWGGVPLELLAEGELSFELPRLLTNTVREIACARRMMREERPAAIVMTEDRSTCNRGVGFSARAFGVPALLLQWGAIAPNATWLARVAADVVAVEGEAGAEVLRASAGGKDLRIAVTGQPRYDRLRQKARQVSRTDMCERLGMDPARPIVLYAAHPIREGSAGSRRNHAEESHLRDEVVAVVRAIGALPGVQLLLKPHPNESSDFHQKVTRDAVNPDIRLVSSQESVEPLLFICDVVVTHRSTVGLEGILLGKPLVLVTFSSEPSLSYVEEGVALGARRAEEVEPMLRAVVFDRETKAAIESRRPAFLRRHTGPADGSATERVVELILGLDSVSRPARQAADLAAAGDDVEASRRSLSSRAS